MEKNFSKIQKELNLKFKNLKLLKFAITHKSYDSMNNYEKFEFLGDRVVRNVALDSWKKKDL